MKTKAISILLALIFLASGLAKLASLEFELVAFQRWGYPIWFMYLIGTLEVAGGIGLVVQRLSAAAGAALALMMVGAIGTHIVHSEWGMLAVASLIFLMSTARAYLGRADLRSLVTQRTHTEASSQ
jgi:putative oxidoreductase